MKTCHRPVGFSLAVILYSRFKGMLQEHLIQGKIHQVIRHKYLACLGKPCGLLTTACRNVNEFLLSACLVLHTLPSASAAVRLIEMEVSHLPLYHHLYKTYSMEYFSDLRVLQLCSSRCLTLRTRALPWNAKQLMVFAEPSVCIGMSVYS